MISNLSPFAYCKQNELYDNKICTGDEAAECRGCMENRMASVGYHLVVDRGDFKKVYSKAFIKKAEGSILYHQV